MALWRAQERVLARSIKYHRPRGAFCFEGHCGACLMRIGGQPNLRACIEPCKDGLEVEGQNAYPSPELDVLAAVDFLFPRGMDHHTMMTGSRILSAVTQKLVRQLSGLGTLPDSVPGAALAEATLTPEVAVIGGGPAGLAAATHAATLGASVLLVDDKPAPGGSLFSDPRFGPAESERRARAAGDAGAEILASSQAIGFFPEDRGGVLAVARADKLLLLKPRVTVYATGGYAENQVFEDNDRPGVIAARGAGRLLATWGILPGRRVVLAEDHHAPRDYADALVAALSQAGTEVIRLPQGTTVMAARGRSTVEAAVISDVEGHQQDIDCDAILVWRRPAPASELLRQHGCAVTLLPEQGGFAVTCNADGETTAPGILACGDVTGYLGPERAAEYGQRAGARAAALATEAEK